MAWTPREVKDQIVEFPNRFKIDGVPHIIEPDFGTVVEPGTPINKAYLQPIEDYLAQVETKDEIQARINALAGEGNTKTVKQLDEELNSHKNETAQNHVHGLSPERVRAIYVSTDDPDDEIGEDGDIWIKYEE